MPSEAVHVTPALSLRQCLHSRAMTRRACASGCSHLQGPPLPRPSWDSQNVRVGKRPLCPLDSPRWTHLPLVSLSQSPSRGTLLSCRTRPCPGPTISPRQPLKSPSSSMTRATSSRRPPFSTAGTSEMGTSLLTPLDAPNALALGGGPVVPRRVLHTPPPSPAHNLDMPGAPALCQTRDVWRPGGEPVTGPAFEVPDETTDCTRNLKRLKKKTKRKFLSVVRRGTKIRKAE